MKQADTRDILKKIKPFYRKIALAILVVLTISFARNITKIRSAGGRIEKARQKNEILEQEIEKLSSQLEILKSDEHVESEIRNKLGLAKKGETVVVMPDNEILRKIAPRVKYEKDSLPLPNWRLWVELFM